MGWWGAQSNLFKLDRFYITETINLKLDVILGVLAGCVGSRRNV
jgi:hypothetical protein